MQKSARLLGVAAGAAGLVLAACPRAIPPEQELLSVQGTLERNGVSGEGSEPVEMAYESTQARGEWWPCDLRLTAAGCVGDHHVNVYVGLPGLTSLDELGRAGCVEGDTAQGVYEEFQKKRTFALGTELSAFVVVASDVVEPAGALLDDPEETTAASRIATGTLTIDRFVGLESLSVRLEGQTAEGRPVEILFGGPTSAPSVVPPLEKPSTCVDSALVEE